LNFEELNKLIDKVNQKLIQDHQWKMEFQEKVLAYTVLDVFVLELVQ
jgi:hypothetical protein